MSNMEAFRQAAPPPRRGRPIVLSSDSEGDDYLPLKAKPEDSNRPMRPTDVQQVEARRIPADQQHRIRLDKESYHVSRPSKVDSDVEEVFQSLVLGADKTASRNDDPRPVFQYKPLGLPKPRSADQTHLKPGNTQPEIRAMRTVQNGEKNSHSGSRSANQGGSKPVSASNNSQDDWTRHRDHDRRPVSPPKFMREEPRPKPQHYLSSATSIPPRLDPSKQADYSKFKSGGAFASPVRRQDNSLQVDPSSKFARAQPHIPVNSWMTDQLNTHHAMQRLNGRPPAGPSTSIPAYGVATGSSSYGGANTVVPQRKEDDGEEFSNALNNIRIDPDDHHRVSADQAEADMRELLSGAIGDGEDDQGEQGSNLVDGFAEGMSLMPHQVRGVAWMGKRETGRSRGGILADDMGLGKTVQTIAMILKRPRTKAEEKLGFEKTTLIVTPVAVMDQWIKEIKNKTTFGRLKVCCYHGPQRSKYADKLQKYDVVVTTYSTLSSEHGAPVRGATSKTKPSADSESESDSDGERFGKSIKKAKTKKSPLYELKWLRIVCDEAQNIKNRSTKAAKAAVALDARLRWCLTGTPIQNNVEELFSLFQFLRAKPLDDWNNFKVQIVQPVKQGKVKFAMKKIHAVLKAVMLRRTKDATIDGKAILNLPARNVNVISCEFDKAERDFYDALEKKQALTFNRFLKAGTAMANYTSVLTLLLRMRQACCHPSLVTASLSVDAAAIDSKPSNEEAETDELADLLQGVELSKTRKCEVCLAPLEDPVATSCDECQQFVRKVRAGSDVTSSMPPSSAKTRMTLEILRQIDERSDGRQKTIIFSQFTSFLNIVEPFLKQAGVRYVRYDGSMRADKREQALEAIRSDPEIRVILISFKAGSTGLNLTCCNNVILLDLWWNPALEDQAYDRAHRLGQKLDVHIYKLTVRESVEDRILKLQEAKRELAKAALSGDSTKNMKLQLQDLMDLFRPGRGASRDDDDD